MVTDEMVEKAARCIDPDAFAILDGGDQWRIINSHHQREATKIKVRAALETALSAAEPVEQDENPMRFFADNVDNWGALEWFNRLVDACEDHDRKRTQAFRCADPDEKDMLSLSADTSKMIMSSSAFRLAREHKDEIRSALSAQVQDVATARDALHAIANLPTGKNIDVCQGHEEAYRAVEALFSTPPKIQVQDVAKPDDELFWRLRIAYKRGAEWRDTTGAMHLVDKASYDYADKITSPLPAAPAKQEG